MGRFIVPVRRSQRQAANSLPGAAQSSVDIKAPQQLTVTSTTKRHQPNDAAKPPGMMKRRSKALAPIKTREKAPTIVLTKPTTFSNKVSKVLKTGRSKKTAGAHDHDSTVIADEATQNTQEVPKTEDRLESSNEYNDDGVMMTIASPPSSGSKFGFLSQLEEEAIGLEFAGERPDDYHYCCGNLPETLLRCKPPFDGSIAGALNEVYRAFASRKIKFSWKTIYPSVNSCYLIMLPTDTKVLPTDGIYWSGREKVKIHEEGGGKPVFVTNTHTGGVDSNRSLVFTRWRFHFLRTVCGAKSDVSRLMVVSYSGKALSPPKIKKTRKQYAAAKYHEESDEDSESDSSSVTTKRTKPIVRLRRSRTSKQPINYRDPDSSEDDREPIPTSSKATFTSPGYSPSSSESTSPTVPASPESAYEHMRRANIDANRARMENLLKGTA